MTDSFSVIFKNYSTKEESKIDVNENMTISKIKEILAEKHAVSTSKIRLIHNGNVLKNNSNTVTSCNIKKDSFVIYLVNNKNKDEKKPDETNSASSTTSSSNVTSTVSTNSSTPVQSSQSGSFSSSNPLLQFQTNSTPTSISTTSTTNSTTSSENIGIIRHTLNELSEGKIGDYLLNVAAKQLILDQKLLLEIIKKDPIIRSLYNQDPTNFQTVVLDPSLYTEERKRIQAQNEYLQQLMGMGMGMGIQPGYFGYQQQSGIPMDYDYTSSSQSTSQISTTSGSQIPDADPKAKDAYKTVIATLGLKNLTFETFMQYYDMADKDIDRTVALLYDR
jgi:Ubiquitin family.